MSSIHFHVLSALLGAGLGAGLLGAGLGAGLFQRIIKLFFNLHLLFYYERLAT